MKNGGGHFELELGGHFELEFAVLSVIFLFKLLETVLLSSILIVYNDRLICPLVRLNRAKISFVVFGT